MMDMGKILRVITDYNFIIRQAMTQIRGSCSLSYSAAS